MLCRTKSYKSLPVPPYVSTAQISKDNTASKPIISIQKMASTSNSRSKSTDQKGKLCTSDANYIPRGKVPFIVEKNGERSITYRERAANMPSAFMMQRQLHQSSSAEPYSGFINGHNKIQDERKKEQDVGNHTCLDQYKAEKTLP